MACFDAGVAAGLTAGAAVVVGTMGEAAGAVGTTGVEGEEEATFVAAEEEATSVEAGAVETSEVSVSGGFSGGEGRGSPVVIHLRWADRIW